MAGGHYVALSGMRTRLDELDRLASDLANVGTAGYKAERTGHRNVPRPVFDDALESAIDSSLGARRLDARAGAIEPTGRAMDVAIEGTGFLAVDTPAGPVWGSPAALVTWNRLPPIGVRPDGFWKVASSMTPSCCAALWPGIVAETTPSRVMLIEVAFSGIEICGSSA